MDTMLIWTQKVSAIFLTTLYNIISMIILNNYEAIMSLCVCTDNHNVILNVSDRSVEKLASPDKILESKTS